MIVNNKSIPGIFQFAVGQSYEPGDIIISKRRLFIVKKGFISESDNKLKARVNDGFLDRLNSKYTQADLASPSNPKGIITKDYLDNYVKHIRSITSLIDTDVDNALHKLINASPTEFQGRIYTFDNANGVLVYSFPDLSAPGLYYLMKFTNTTLVLKDSKVFMSYQSVGGKVVVVERYHQLGTRSSITDLLINKYNELTDYAARFNRASGLNWDLIAKIEAKDTDTKWRELDLSDKLRGDSDTIIIIFYKLSSEITNIVRTFYSGATIHLSDSNITLEGGKIAIVDPNLTFIFLKVYVLR